MDAVGSDHTSSRSPECVVLWGADLHEGFPHSSQGSILDFLSFLKYWDLKMRFLGVYYVISMCF
jgi:hypothetical protein